MNVVDANVLIYAVNRDAPQHDRARLWLDGSLSGEATVGFAWVAVLAFLRLTTKSGVFPTPLSVRDATDRVQAWLAQPAAMVLEPTARHLAVVSKLLMAVGTGANLVNDVHLAALAIEHRGRVVSFDSDFARLPGVVWVQPPPV